MMRAGRRRMAAAAVVDGGGMKRKERRGGGWTSAAIVDGAIAATGTPCCGGTARGPTQNPRSQWPWSTISGDGAEAERMLSGDGDDDGRSGGGAAAWLFEVTRWRISSLTCVGFDRAAGNRRYGDSVVEIRRVGWDGISDMR